MKEKDIDKIVQAINYNTRSVNQVIETGNRANNKIKELLEVNEKIQYNTNIISENTKKFNYSKGVILLFVILVILCYCLFYKAYYEINNYNVESINNFFEIALEAFSNGFVAVIIIPICFFISYKVFNKKKKEKKKMLLKNINVILDKLFYILIFPVGLLVLFTICYFLST